MFLWPCSLAVPVLAGWVYAFCVSMPRNSRRLNRQWFLFSKRLRRRSNGLKSHPTDWEKPGIEPAIPGLQDIGLSLHNDIMRFSVLGFRSDIRIELQAPVMY